MSHSPRVVDHPAAEILVFNDAPSASDAAAERIVQTVRDRVAARGRAVLGLATGHTPLALYEHLVARHRADGLSFKDVITYNLDEFYPISPLDPNSYRAYMHQHLFSLVDLAPHRAHVFDGTVPERSVGEHAATYDRWIADDGGLDFQLLGIGRNGHIGFNEPSDAPADEVLSLPSRVADLHPITIEDAARDFGGDPDRVPRRALTMGVAPILLARTILVLAFGPKKAGPVAAALNGPMTAALPGSLLRAAKGRVTWMLDEPAARGLS